MYLSNYNPNRCMLCYADRPMINSQCTNPYGCDSAHYNVKQHNFEIKFEYYDYFCIFVWNKKLYRDYGKSRSTPEFMFDLDDKVDFKDLIHKIDKFEVFK